MKALEALTSAMAGRKVPVVCRGTEAYTDNTKVVIPYLGDTLTDEQVTLLRGYNDHESEHVVSTDFDLLKRAAQESMQLKNMLNIVEDLRIEKKRGKKYAGAFRNLQAMAQHVFDDPSDKPIGKMLYEGRRQVCGYQFDHPCVADELKAYFGNTIFDDIANSRNTREALTIARAMLEIHNQKLAAEQEQQQGPGADDENGEHEQESNEDQQGQDSSEQFESEDEGDSGDDTGGSDEDSTLQGGSDEELLGTEDSEQGSNSDEELDGNGDGETAPEGDTENEGSDGAEQAGASSQDSDDESQTSARDVEDELNDFEDPITKMRDELGQWHEQFCLTDQYHPYTTEYDTVVQVEPLEDMDAFNRYKRQLGNLNSLRAKAVQMFKARTARRWYGGQESGKINSRTLARVKMGDTKVFKRRTNNQEIDTAVTFVIDMSGSMIGEKLREAIRATILLLETLNGAGVKTEVTGFTTDKKCHVHLYREYEFDCCEGQIDYVIKSFDENYGSVVKRKVASCESLTWGHTNDFAGLRFAYRRIVNRREKRKIIIMLSDGDTSVYGNVTNLRKHMKKQIKEINSRNIELLAYGLHDNAVMQYYQNHVIVNPGDNLGEKVLEGLKKILNV